MNHLAGPPVLSRRALNRALLARQALLERVETPAVAMIEHLAGMQAQAPNAPYVGLWTRLAGFDAAELAGLVETRQVVRASLMRVTIHLVSRTDFLAWWPILQPVLERGFRNSAFRRNLAGLDLEHVVAVARATLEQEPRTRADLGARLADRWPGRDPLSLAIAIGHRESTVQVPPRGVWGRSGAATLALGEAWLGGTIAPNAAPDELVRRYLGAFGPATINDAQSWSGMTHLRDVFEQLRPTLVEFRDTADRTLFDLPEAPRPAEDSPAPPRYLPEYDNLLLGHVDRTRVIDKQHKTTLYPGNGARLGAVLLGGRYAGGWKIVEPTSEARLEVQLLAKPSQSDRDGLVEEGLGLLAFAAPASAGRDVSITVAA